MFGKKMEAAWSSEWPENHNLNSESFLGYIRLRIIYSPPDVISVNIVWYLLWYLLTAFKIQLNLFLCMQGYDINLILRFPFAEVWNEVTVGSCKVKNFCVTSKERLQYVFLICCLLLPKGKQVLVRSCLGSWFSAPSNVYVPWNPQVSHMTGKVQKTHKLIHDMYRYVCVYS
jgi:hypothetical protein